jgi:hypothetical protein
MRSTLGSFIDAIGHLEVFRGLPGYPDLEERRLEVFLVLGWDDKLDGPEGAVRHE